MNDVALRNGIANAEPLRRMLKILAERSGEPVSFSALAKSLETAGSRLSKATVIRYVECAVRAGLLLPIENMADRLRQKEGRRKYCFADNGFLFLLGQNDRETLLENLVAVELMRRHTGKDSVFYVRDKAERDFYLPGEDGKTLSTDESMNAGVAGIGDELVNDLMPKIAKEYNTYAQVAADADAVTVDAALKANRAHQGYAGLSMGSAISFTTIWTSCLDYFAYIGSYSGATTVENAQQIANAANTTYKNDKIGYWYVGLGTIEKDGMDYPGDPLGCYRTMLAGINGLQSGSDLSAGDNCQFVKCNNTGHNYQSWITALYNSMMVFFQADIA